MISGKLPVSGRRFETQVFAGEREICPVNAVSLLELYVYPGRVDVFERQGDGKTAELLEILRRLGLETSRRTSSFCG